MATQLMLFVRRYSLLLILWLILWLKPTFFIHPWLIQHHQSILLYSPIIAVGIYALVNVLYGVATFNDCKQAKEALVKEIIEAKKDLRKRKIID
jgi:hypothetical protein